MSAAAERRVLSLITKYLSRGDPKVNPKIQLLLDGFRNSSLDRTTSKPSFKPDNLHAKVFANNYLNFGALNVIGFDLDYTLVTYKVELQSLIYELARDILVSAYCFPPSLKDCKFDPGFPVRGLSVDIKNGTLCKLSHIQRVGLRSVYKGKRALTPYEIGQLYGEARHVSQGDISQMKPLNDQFSMAEACLLADAIEVLEHKKNITGEHYSPSAVIEDVRASIEEVHISGVMHQTVLKDMDKYINKSSQLPALLDHFKSADKRLFLVTNSGFNFAEKAITYALDLPEKSDSKEWRELFDVIICSAKKPSFYTSNKPFRMLNLDSRKPSTKPVTDLKRGEVYLNGSVQALTKAMGWTGKEILYIGDNLYADLVEARRLHGWQTACVVHELEDEIDKLHTESFCSLHESRAFIRLLLQQIQSEFEFERRENKYKKLEVADEGFIHDLDMELQTLSQEISHIFHPHFGSVFRTCGNPTYLAFNIRRYVDIYMANVCDLLHYSPTHRFFPSRPILMAHDPRQSASAALLSDKAESIPLI